jgi:hypothetical protein
MALPFLSTYWVQALGQELSITAEPVDKVQTANFNRGGSGSRKCRGTGCCRRGRSSDIFVEEEGKFLAV